MTSEFQQKNFKNKIFPNFYQIIKMMCIPIHVFFKFLLNFGNFLKIIKLFILKDISIEIFKTYF